MALKQLIVSSVLVLSASCSSDDGSNVNPADMNTGDMGVRDTADTTESDQGTIAPDSGGDSGGGVEDTGSERARALVVGTLGEPAVHRFSLEDLSPTASSPATFGGYNDVATGGGWIALPVPASREVVVVNAETLDTVATATLSRTPLTAAIDATRDILYVFAADGLDREFNAFQIGADSLTPVEGSPFATDLVATEFKVHEETGRLVGVSTSTAWMAEPDGTPLFGSPISVTAGSVVIDSARDRVLYTSSFPSQLHARSINDFSLLSGSPVALPGEFPTSLDIDAEGNTFVLDGASLGSMDPTTLVRVTASPFELAATCGSTDGCPLPNTETGLAIDASSDRLYVTEVTGEETDGRVHAWDISNPESPTDLQTPVNVSPIPAWISID